MKVNNDVQNVAISSVCVTHHRFLGNNMKDDNLDHFKNMLLTMKELYKTCIINMTLSDHAHISSTVHIKVLC